MLSAMARAASRQGSLFQDLKPIPWAFYRAVLRPPSAPAPLRPPSRSISPPSDRRPPRALQGATQRERLGRIHTGELPRRRRRRGRRWSEDPAAARISHTAADAVWCLPEIDCQRLRPGPDGRHQLRETQAASFLRILAAEPQHRQLWAGAESGIRVWALDEVFADWGAGARCGDDENALFREGVPALCVAMDRANGLLWTGHKDGRIRSWRMDLQTAATAPAPPPPGPRHPQRRAIQKVPALVMDSEPDIDFNKDIQASNNCQ